EMEVRKAAPVRAGMAGGSADAAAVLLGLDAPYDARLSMSELCALGAALGADVPFALLGGTCRVQGKGDLLRPLPPCPDCRFVAVMPSVGVSTPAAFAAYDRVGSTIHPDGEAAEAAVRAGDLAALCAAMGNALEECSGAKETPHIKELLVQNGAKQALMTGSGAAVFGVFDDPERAEAARAALAKEYRQVYLASPDRGGARVLPPPKRRG
ncbi:4-(cytidine 5'-diphospho)-2-C-methyl-D-erythritol kinase, partial [Candidatus Allofournierella excrementigallinarum]|uniref:4-(cytidine 5'-diphospho)-2-C-methyl-D-erythritol kinase n=1 Tax=Candidatus Allofournierella excrementigallinarum TaxID=2838592 RepID=UPI00374F013A